MICNDIFLWRQCAPQDWLLILFEFSHDESVGPESRLLQHDDDWERCGPHECYELMIKWIWHVSVEEMIHIWMRLCWILWSSWLMQLTAQSTWWMMQQDQHICVLQTGKYLTCSNCFRSVTRRPGDQWSGVTIILTIIVQHSLHSSGVTNQENQSDHVIQHFTVMMWLFFEGKWTRDTLQAHEIIIVNIWTQ